MFLLAAAGTLPAADFFPLAPGNHWTYRDPATGSTFSVDIGASQILLNDNVYHVLRGYTPRQLFVRLNQYGNLVYWDDERQTDILLTSFEYAGGGRFEAPQRICEQDGQVQERRVSHEGPAGRWSAVEIQYRAFGCGDVGDIAEQFTENIGMVRRVVNTLIGPRTYDLIYARIGRQTIEAGETGAFAISAANQPESGTWAATLRIHLPLGTNFKLNFPSGQEYDLRLRDLEGRIVWSWSADKLFAQVAHSIDAASFTATVTVPYPPSIGGTHLYILEAWMTNAREEPQFAGATLVATAEIAPARATRSRP